MFKKLLYSIILLLFVCLEFTMAQDLRRKNFPVRQVSPERMPRKKNLWIFIMAGQSNMAGRGIVEPEDTLPHSRVLYLDPDGRWMVAKEPLHQYQPSLTGLDCGLSFGKELASKLRKKIVIGLVPCAVGGTSVDDWLGDSLKNGVKLKSNFMARVDLARETGTIKGILWHQGEADTDDEKTAVYGDKLLTLFAFFRLFTGDDTLPVIMGELGIFRGNEKNLEGYIRINNILHSVDASDGNCYLVHSDGLVANNDNVHFNNQSQRILGQRYAEKYLETLKIKKERF